MIHAVATQYRGSASPNQETARLVKLLCSMAALSLLWIGESFTYHKHPTLITHNLTGVAASLPITPPVEGPDLLPQISLERRVNSAYRIGYVVNLISSTGLSPKAAEALGRTIVHESEQAGVDPLFVAAVIKYESTFRHDALSNAGALGLMQILPETARYLADRHGLAWRGTSSLKDPAFNIRLGIAYMKQLLELFDGNHTHMLVAYNWGPGNLQRALRARQKMPRAPLQYAQKIISSHADWNSELQIAIGASPAFEALA